LIQAHQKHYGFDFAPAFWDWLDREYEHGTIASVRKVLDELTGQDALAVWAKKREFMFCEPDAVTQRSLRDLSDWSEQSYPRALVDEFSRVADHQLVAYAHAHRYVVVTHEQPSEKKQKKYRKIQIPDACQAFGVHWLDPFSMLRAEHARFVLADIEPQPIADTLPLL
jgi:hypothetical protein